MNNSIYCIFSNNQIVSRRIFEIIRGVASEFGLDALSVDNSKDLRNHIFQDVWAAILDSKIILVDITNATDDVIYKIGLAHGLGKNVIIINEKKTKIPYFLKVQNTVTYNNSLNGFDDIERFKFKLESIIQGIMHDADFASQFKGPFSIPKIDIPNVIQSNVSVDNIIQNSNKSTTQIHSELEEWAFNIANSVPNWEVVKYEGKVNGVFDFFVWNSIIDNELSILGNPLPFEIKILSNLRKIDLSSLQKKLEKQSLNGLVLITSAIVDENDIKFVKRIFQESQVAIIILDYSSIKQIKSSLDFINTIREKVQELALAKGEDFYV